MPAYANILYLYRQALGL